VIHINVGQKKNIMKQQIAIALFAFAYSLTASAEEITPIEKLERGMTVSVRGEVTRILDEDEFRMRDSTGSVRIYIGWKNRVTVPVGETITVRGVVDDDLESRFRPEIYAFQIVRKDGTAIDLNKREESSPEESTGDVAREDKDANSDEEEKNITPIGDLKRGMPAEIQGKVIKILDEDEFRIEDSTGSVRVYIGWRNRMVVRVGEEIGVRGVVDDDLRLFFRPELYATEITREDGTTIELDK